MHYYFKVLRSYIDFGGRASRSEYWYFFLFQFVFLALILLTEMVLVALYHFDTDILIYKVYAVGTLLPSIAVGVRRLHDIGKSGSYYFMIFIPIAGPIFLLVQFCTAGDVGENPYGPDPLTSGE